MARTTMRRLEPRAAVVAMGLWLGGVGVAAQPSSVDPVVLVRVPDAGLQPSAEVVAQVESALIKEDLEAATRIGVVA